MVWHTLPPALQSTDTREQFKRRLKGWLFESSVRTAGGVSDRY